MKTYNPKEVSVIIGSRPLKGFADGTFVKAGRDADAYTKKVGVDGEVTRTKTNDKSGTIEITLQQSAEDNDYLSSIALTDELTGAGTVPALIRDAKGTSLATSPAVWVKKLPEMEFGKESGNRAWVFECAILEMFHGSN